MPRVQVRLLKSQDEYRECERIQKAVWGTYAVSSEVLTVTQKYGGAVLGAIVERKVVGFIYAFLARRHGRLVHWSHEAGASEDCVGARCFLHLLDVRPVAEPERDAKPREIGSASGRIHPQLLRPVYQRY